MHGIDRRSFLAGLGVMVIAGRGVARDMPGRVVLRQGSRYVIEGGQEHRLADTVFEVAAGTAGEAIGLEVGPGARIDVLRIRLAPGVRDIDRFVRIGAGAHIGLIDVEAAEQTDRGDNPLDGFVQIRDDDISIDTMRFVRIERCALIAKAARIRIGTFDCTSYSKGMRIFRSEDVSIGAFRTRIASPNAILGKPGENGLIVDDTRRLVVGEADVEDAAEHSIYLAGGDEEYANGDVRFGRVVSRRAGRCGFKCKTRVSRSHDVSIDTLEVFDSAHGSQPKGNKDALRVENCRGFRIGRLTAQAAETRASCHVGVYLDGVEDFALAGGYVDRSQGPLVQIRDSRGPNRGIAIAGLDGSRLASHGYHLHHTRGNRLEGLAVDGGVLDGVAGDAVLIDGNAVAVPGTNHIRIAARHVRGALVEEPAAPRAAMAGIEVQVEEMG